MRSSARSGELVDTEWLTAHVAAHRDELVALRRHLHAYPERSGEERETTDLLVQRLRAAGLSPRVLPRGTGLLCDIGTGGGSVVALRADIDALAMDDDKDVPYRSQVPGIAHACGHDVHTTIVLGAGLALAEHLADSNGGRVRLLFEPAEETVPGGAVDVIAAGGLDDVDAVFGLHCDPKRDVGHLGVRIGPITSASDSITVHLHGPGGHTARPHLTVDLVALAGRVAAELPALVRARAGPHGELLVVFGAMHAGDAANVIPATATLKGSVRSPQRDLWDRAAGLVEGSISEMLAGTGATWTVDYRRGVPPVDNHEVPTRWLADAGRVVLGADAVGEAPQSTGGDSFSWYAQEVPATFGRLGVHDPSSGRPRLDLHASTFDVDERAIGLGVQVLVRATLTALASRPTS